MSFNVRNIDTENKVNYDHVYNFKLIISLKLLINSFKYMFGKIKLIFKSYIMGIK